MMSFGDFTTGDIINVLQILGGALNNAADELRDANQHEKCQWISVKDGQPKKYKDDRGSLIPYLVFVKGGKYPFLSLYRGNRGWITDDVTHWMPLPEPPAET